MPVAVGAAQSFIEGEFGGPTEENAYEISVSIEPTVLVGNDPEALALTIINIGSAAVSVMFDDRVSSTRGILLQSNGGSVSMTIRDDQTLPTRAWWAITNTGTTDLFILRTRRYALTGAS